MVSYSKELTTIKELLEKNPQGMTITDISKVLTIYRKTTAKYLDMLLITGQVEMRPFGPVKIFTPSRRIPASSMLDFSRDYIVVLDGDLNIFELNARALQAHAVQREELVGKYLGETTLPYYEDTLLMEKLSEAVSGKEYLVELQESHFFGISGRSLELVPLTFDDGSTGVALVVVNDEGRTTLEADLRKRDVLLRSLSFLISNIGTDRDFDTVAGQLLEKIGEGLVVSRVYLCRNRGLAGSDLSYERIMEWVAIGTEGYVEFPDLKKISYKRVGPRLEETLSRGKMYFGHIKDFLEEERNLFNPQGIISIMLAPIFVDGEWWGFLGIDQCAGEWNWSSGELEGLKTISGILGRIIEHSASEGSVK